MVYINGRRFVYTCLAFSMPDGSWTINTLLKLMDYLEMMTMAIDFCIQYNKNATLLCIMILGTMSAWFVWGTLGLYPLTGTDKYFLGSPAIDNATLHFENGNNY